jgi:hypothetical protein
MRTELKRDSRKEQWKKEKNYEAFYKPMWTDVGKAK